MLVLVGPVMLSLDCVFKPLFQKKGWKFVGALVFLIVCGAWWLIVIFGSINLGLAQLIRGNSSS